MKVYQSLGLTLGLILTTIQPTFASISIGASRIIFNADVSNKSVDINNRSQNQPYLINVGISRDIPGKSVDTPFIVAPTLFRIEPGTTNKVRIIKQSNSLPNDRESLFYFNSMVISTGKTEGSKNSSAVDGALQVATGNTLKLFYRPGNLAITQKEAMGKLQFTQDGKGTKVNNPTPYYISLAKLNIDGKTVKLDVITGSSMIAPFSSYVYPVNAPRSKVEWKAINDFGGVENFHGAIN